MSRIEQLLGSEPEQAGRLATDLLTRSPGLPAARLFLGIAKRLSYDPAGAIDVLQPLVLEHPNSPMAHLQLGLAFREANRDADAEKAMRRAVAVKSDYADAWLALADLLTGTGDKQAADQAYIKYANCSNNDPRLRDPISAMRDQDFRRAETLLRNLLQVQPCDIVAICMLAEACEYLGRTNDSESLLEHCLELSPSFVRARLSYATVLLRHNKIQEALTHSTILLDTEPDNPDFLKLQAAIYLKLREFDQAIEIYEKLLAMQPDQSGVMTNMGHVLRSIGRSSEAVDIYRNAIAVDPGNGEAYWNIANMKTAPFNDDELEIMRVRADDPGLTETDRVNFYFAIGKALEDRGEHAESFRYYDRGNTLHHKNTQFNAGEFTEYVNRCIKFFNRDFYVQRDGWGIPDKDPIFIIGLPRAGSTLVEQILASHTRIEGTMELPEIVAMASSLDKQSKTTSGKKYPELLAEFDSDNVRKLGTAYIQQTRIYRRQAREHFIDKMPENFIHAGLILLILPNARIIDVRRHPMSSGFSLYKQHFARRRDFSYNLHDIGRYYIEYVRLMTHIERTLPGRIHRVHYETLVQDTEAEIRRLLDYCGLEFQQSCLEFHRNRRDVNTPSSEQVRSPIYNSAVEKWHSYEDWLAPLYEIVGPLADVYPALPDDMDLPIIIPGGPDA